MTVYRRYLPPFVMQGTNSDAGELALHPLFVPGMTRPVIDGDGGISIAVLADSEDGVLFVIDPWFAMFEDDTIDVFIDNENVHHHVVTATDVNKRLIFFVDKKYFIPGWIEQCYFKLHRIGEAMPDDPSVAMRLRVKTNRPAGRDKEPHKPGHSELRMVQLPEEIIREGIDAQTAAQGVPMTIQRYPDIALHDTIRVKWGRVMLTPLVLTQAHVDGTTPIVVRAEHADILAGGDGEAVLIEYQVYDLVWNFAEKWSISTTVKVDAGAWRLEAPIIKESVDGVIDLKDLDQRSATVQINLTTEYFEKDDSITMTWTGTPQIGPPLIDKQTIVVTSVPKILELSVPYEIIRPIAGGSVDVSYVLTKKDGSPSLSSRPRFADVLGDPYQHPAPTLQEAIGEILEPETLIATARVAYPGMANGDFVELVWEGTQSNGSPYVHVEEHMVSRNDAERAEITLYFTSEHIKVLTDGQLKLWYRVSNDEVAFYGVSESEFSRYRVQAITASLPPPKVLEADENNVLDPAKIFDKATVEVDYSKTVSGDILTYYWRGSNPFASTSGWLPITKVSEGKPVRFRVDAEFVSANIGVYVKVRYVLLHGATGRFSYSAPLDLLVGYLVGELPPPEVAQARNETLDPMDALMGVDINVSYKSMDPALDIIILKWLGTPGAGTSEDLELPGHSSGTVTFHLAPSFVGPNVNRLVSVGYSVKRYGHETPSQILALRVLNFQNPDNQLPRPQVPQAVADVLDLMEFAGDAEVVVQTWPLIAMGQRIWLRVTGRTATGASYPITLLDGVLITTAQVNSGLRETLSRIELLKLAHASPATVECKVAFDGTPQESAAVEFPTRQLRIRTRYDYLTPVITSVMDLVGNVENGGKTRYDKLTINGTATRGETIELFDNVSQSMGEALTGVDGFWHLDISNLSERTYVITAKALYDADPVLSQPWTFMVEFTVTPRTLSVTDSKGLVAQNARTYDSSVLIEGDATAGKQVRLHDGTTPIITLDVDDEGMWRYRYNNLAVKSYQLIAQALYDVIPVNSAPYPFSVAQTVVPTISTVTDAKGNVANNETTYYRTVTLSGAASKDEDIVLLDGNDSLQTIRVDPNGRWTWELNNLALKTYRLVAKGLYGDEPVSSPARVFTVADPFSPTITRVIDSNGEVAHGATTYNTAVTAHGEATPREQVQLYDNNAPVGSPATVGANKVWSVPVAGLAVRSHSLIARALYPVSPVDSRPRNFTVAAHIFPTITSVREGSSVGSEIPNGQQTKSTTVYLQGNVTSAHQVQVFDNGAGKHFVTAAGTTWSTTLAVAIGGHSITVRASATGQVSNARGFTVIPLTPPLTINTAHVALGGWIFRSDHTPTNPPAGSFVDRHASGGVAPYQYSSSNPAVAEVNISNGRVISKGNGSAVITVRDGAGQTASYSVSVSNVYRIFEASPRNTYTLCRNAAASQGGRVPSLAEWRSYISTYAGLTMTNAWCWASDSAGFAKRWAIFPATGQTQALKDLVIGGNTAIGFGIR